MVLLLWLITGHESLAKLQQHRRWEDIQPVYVPLQEIEQRLGITERLLNFCKKKQSSIVKRVSLQNVLYLVLCSRELSKGNCLLDFSKIAQECVSRVSRQNARNMD